MQSGNSTISELFNSDRIFNVPKYQRAFTWIEENLLDFFDDLINHRGSKNYFLGTLLFHQKGNRGDYEIIDIVDGQQRLTTTIVFQKILINILKERNSSKISNKTYYRYVKDADNVYKLELENDDNSFLHANILDDETATNIETPSQKKLLFAKTYFYDNLSKLTDEKLEHIYDVLTNAEIILYVVNKISDATQIFELLNDRGRRLTELEGIKSFLMYKISSLHLKEFDQPINDIQGNFSSIYRLMEQYHLNEKEILRYHTIAFEKSKVEDYDKPDKYIKEKINGLFENSEQDEIIKTEILDYVKHLKKSFDIVKAIKTNTLKSQNLDNLLMIGRVNPFYPFLMIVYEKNKDDFDKFTHYLTQFTFRATLIGLQNQNEKFYGFIRNNNNLIEIFKLPMNGNWWNINIRVQNTLSFRNFYNSINKNIVKYILFKYENKLREKSGFPLLSLTNYFETDERKKFSIEHISAQKSKNLVYNDDFEQNYLHSLGNLVLDSKASNSRKNNDTIDEKLSEYDKAPLMSQNELNNEQLDWSDIEQVKVFIDNRNDKMLKFINDEMIKFA
jgi:uncharacterized protein with ParB-like and HNH nuclease domain